MQETDSSPAPAASPDPVESTAPAASPAQTAPTASPTPAAWSAAWFASAASRVLTASRPYAATLRPAGANLLTRVRAAAKYTVAVHRPGVRAPNDVRQTWTVMLSAPLVYGLLGYQVWATIEAGATGDFTSGLRTLMVIAVMVGVVLALLAVPVRRAASVLWRTAQAGAVLGLATGLGALYMAARLADTPLLLTGLLAALTAIVINIALWSTAVRRWCDLRLEP